MKFKIGDRVYWKNLVYWSIGTIINIRKVKSQDDFCGECGKLRSKGGKIITFYDTKIEEDGFLDGRKLHATSIGQTIPFNSKDLRLT